MSRTNHLRESFCWACEYEKGDNPSRWGWWRHGIDEPHTCRTFRKIDARRPWERKPRYPKYGMKSWHSGPSRWWWQEQHAKARAIYRQIMRRDDDPALPRERDLIDLYGWY